MRVVLVYALVIASVVLVDSAMSLTFEEWSDYHGKEYSSLDERNRRRTIWLENHGVVQRHNRAFRAGYTSWSMTMSSPFADWTSDEFATHYLMESQNCSATTHKSSGPLRGIDDHIAASNKTIQSVDWRTKGIMTPVKNQGHCGSCCKFSCFDLCFNQL